MSYFSTPPTVCVDVAEVKGVRGKEKGD